MATLLAHDPEHIPRRAVHVPNRPQKAGQLVKAPKKANEKLERAADPCFKKKKPVQHTRMAVLTSDSVVERGLLALILHRNNYQTVFLEFDQNEVDLINNTGSYTVSEIDEQGVQVNSVICNCRAIHATEQRAEAIHTISEAEHRHL
jgi:hypothetical protein